jgi:hypothetical protein
MRIAGGSLKNFIKTALALIAMTALSDQEKIVLSGTRCRRLPHRHATIRGQHRPETGAATH